MATNKKINLGLPTNKDGSVNRRFANTFGLLLNKDGTINRRSVWNKDFATAYNLPKQKATGKAQSEYSRYSKVFNKIRGKYAIKLDIPKAKKTFYAELKGKKLSNRKLSEFVSKQFKGIESSRKRLLRSVRGRSRYKYKGRFVSELVISNAAFCCEALMEQGYECDYGYIVNLWFTMVDKFIEVKDWLHAYAKNMGYREMSDFEKLNADVKLRQLEEQRGFNYIKTTLKNKDKIIVSFMSFDVNGYYWRQECQTTLLELFYANPKIRIKVKVYGSDKVQNLSFTKAMLIIDEQLWMFWTAKDIMHSLYPMESQAFSIYMFHEVATGTAFIDFNDFRVDNMPYYEFEELLTLKQTYEADRFDEEE